ncbi:unnamed protein product [Meganyctiphanes norvegica]|uniref:Uncharacterized protein n=1 Tax=Meganyctiphanes norvegica TaxID=48144 RepID=A0AAV2Q4C0_MEGNR
MKEGNTHAKLNRYRDNKIAQAIICFHLILITVGLISKYIDLADIYGVILILVSVFLISFILTITAAIVLHCGNTNSNVGALKTFIVLGSMTYSCFDVYAGGFPVVRQRIQEIEQGPPTVDPM